MKNCILENIDSTETLEDLYQSDKRSFEKAFAEVYPEIAGKEIAGFWKARLEHTEKKENGGFNTRDFMYLVISCMFAGLLIEIPQIFHFSAEDFSFYERNAGSIVFLGLFFYAVLTKMLTNSRQLLVTAVIFILTVMYANLLPLRPGADSIDLAFLHIPLLLWFLYGLVYIGYDIRDKARLIAYIKYNGALLILAALISITGGMLAGASLELFSTIGLEIGDFYFNYVVLIGAVSLPVVATFIIRHYPAIANRIAPVIANIFSPLVLITLLVYLISIPITGKSPYNDRDFLLIFNLMQLGVLALVIFTVSESRHDKKQRFVEIVMFVLSCVALIVDLIALSAIVYRLGEFGLSPNRIAVLGSNLLVLGNLALIIRDLFQINFTGKTVAAVERTIASYLPAYALWIIFVVFVLPLIFKYQ